MAVTAKAPKKLTDDLGQEFDLDFKDVAYGTNPSSGQILLPEGMALSEGIWWLKTRQKELETLVSVNELVEGYPADVAYSLGLAIQKIFGIRELQATPGFWGDSPPTFISVPCNHKRDMVEIFLGRFALPGIEGVIETARVWNDGLMVTGSIRQKSLPAFRNLLKVTREHLSDHSLYKGKAIRVRMTEECTMFEKKLTMADPEFIDTGFMPAQLTLNAATYDLLDATLWSVIERTDQTRHYSTLKRIILLEGPYGTGKTLSALETARRAQLNGWTFIYLTRVHDLQRVYSFAARYSPSVIFAEDIDLITRATTENPDSYAGVNMLNNILDGVDSKNNPVILVLTTNHADQLPQSLLRPGRFDGVISFSLPDAETASRLVVEYAGTDLDQAHYNAGEVGSRLANNQPATIHEVVKRAKLFAQRRYKPDYRGTLKLTTKDILLSAQSMENHLRLLNKPKDIHPSAVEQFGGIVGNYLKAGILRAMSEHRDPFHEDEVERIEKRITQPAERAIGGNSGAGH